MDVSKTCFVRYGCLKDVFRTIWMSPLLPPNVYYRVIVKARFKKGSSLIIELTSIMTGTRGTVKLPTEFGVVVLLYLDKYALFHIVVPYF